MYPYVCRSSAHGGSPAYLIPNGQPGFESCDCWSHCHHGYTQVSRRVYLEFQQQNG